MSDKISAALEKIPYSVCVVTVGRGGAENGLTVSWLSQVSFEPPMVMVAVDKVHYSEEILRSTKSFVLNLLKADQKKLGGQFARESVAGEDKLKGVPNRPADGGAAILTDALAWFDCEVKAIHSAGDHLLVVAEVNDAGVLNDGDPLTSASGLRYRKSRPKAH